jgi:hypothetical protein
MEPEMDNVVARVAAAAGTDPEVARKAVALMLDFIGRESPPGVFDALLAKAPSLNAVIASGADAGGEGMGAMMRGLMSAGTGAMGGGGLMALGTQLMGLGLDMSQIQAVGKEVFEYAREQAGDDLIGQITAAIPGLSNFI